MSRAQMQLDLHRPATPSEALTLLMMSFPGAKVCITPVYILERHVACYDLCVKPCWLPWTWMRARYTPQAA